MAPKRKTLSQGPSTTTGRRSIRQNPRIPSPSSSSSSSIPEPSVPSSNPLTGRIVTTGRKVNFEFLEAEGFQCGMQLINLGWKKLCSLEVPTYPALVQDFYSTIGRGDGGLVGTVRGRKVSVNQNILSDLLEMPTQGMCPQSHSERGKALSSLMGREISDIEEILANQLSLELRLLHNICGRILFPKTGRFDFVSERDIVLLDCITNGYPLNLPAMMIGYMAEAGSKKKASLPYGMVLTLIFEAQGIQIPESEPKKVLRHTDYYNASTLHRMGYKKVNNNWEKRMVEENIAKEVQAENIQEEEAQPQQATTSAIHQPEVSISEDQFECLKDLIKSEAEKTRNMLQTELHDIKNSMKELETRVIKLEADYAVSKFIIKDELKEFGQEIRDNTKATKDFSDSNAKLMVHNEKSLKSIGEMFSEFKKTQAEGMGAILDRIKRIFS